MKMNRVMLSYEGPSMGTNYVSDVPIDTGRVTEEGDDVIRADLELEHGARVVLTISQELMRSMREGILAFFMRTLPGGDLPPLMVYALRPINDIMPKL